MPLDEEQESALLGLYDVTCKIEEEGCGGPWCAARHRVGVAFGLADPVKEEPDVGGEVESPRTEPEAGESS